MLRHSSSSLDETICNNENNDQRVAQSAFYLVGLFRKPCIGLSANHSVYNMRLLLFPTFDDDSIIDPPLHNQTALAILKHVIQFANSPVSRLIIDVYTYLE